MHRYARLIKLYLILMSFMVLGISLLFFPQFVSFSGEENSYYEVFLCGEDVGTVTDREIAKACLRQARRRLARPETALEDDMLFVDADLSFEERTSFFGSLSSEEDLTASMVSALSDHEERTYTRCYSVRIKKTIVNLATLDEVKELLQKVMEPVLSQYDEGESYDVTISRDASSRLCVLSASIEDTDEEAKNESALLSSEAYPSAGIEAQLSGFFDAVTPQVAVNFDDYTNGKLTKVSFDSRIEIASTYLPESEIETLDDAYQIVTGQEDVTTRYEVKNGDSLDSIAQAYGETANELISDNGLDAGNPVYKPGDLLLVRVQAAPLALNYTIRQSRDENYSADTITKYNDSWYTTKSEVIQDAVEGQRRVLEDVEYNSASGEAVSTTLIKEEVVTEAVPEIIEQGTKNPPTYIWPVSGGYITSGFGHRTKPNAAASSYHQGVDIAVSTGTAVHASSGGTVTQAGWYGNYGYVVFISHGNGVETRYGHLSKVEVSVGETVSQGDVIALSGSTGNSTGPHLHFEMRINGTAVNPLEYVTN